MASEMYLGVVRNPFKLVEQQLVHFSTITVALAFREIEQNLALRAAASIGVCKMPQRSSRRSVK